MSDVFNTLMAAHHRRGGLFFLLIDPDTPNEQNAMSVIESAGECGVDALLVGGSFVLNPTFPSVVERIKRRSSVPVILFPGSSAQVCPHADAILFTSLISGRNPNFLIEEQVKGAPLVKHYNLEPIPTGYMLIESGSLTSVQFVSGSVPIPRHKHDLARAHALAAQYLGMRLVYLEAGSGARLPIPVEMVRAVSEYVTIPVIVGGGLTTARVCA
ncbi:MAG: geranylgeranylglyceryl/heptaprenylglyceryl phosphate synthase [candidate division Zixibacteria bacterium]|nr:geranylgeranylglyceryl/heptaprenylglyceryl phosphate synthase [candidate division Zixibacteria bacterium]